jgi:predicted nucleic acid-binding protein
MMFQLQVPDVVIPIPPESLILDSCVLVSAFLPVDEWHDHARAFLQSDSVFVVPYVVTAEAWGVLVRSKKERRRFGLKMLEWLATSPGIILVPEWKDLMERSRLVCEKYPIDFVDALLMTLASDISNARPKGGHAQIATYDTRDFQICCREFPFVFLDLRSDFTNLAD